MRSAFKPVDGDWIEILPAGVELPGAGEDGEDVVMSAAFVASLPPEARAARGFAEVVLTEAPALPPGLSAVAELVDVDGEPVEAWSIGHITDAEIRDALVGVVNAQRDARIDGGFAYGGDVYQSRASDRENIQALGVQAQLALLGGAAPGDLRWHGGPTDFVWILEDNTTVPLDAPGMVGLFQTGIAFKSALTFTARAKKDWLLDPARTRAELLAFDPAADWPA